MPQARESPTLLCRPGENTLYLFGGICQEPMIDLATFNINHENSRAKYKILQPSTLDGLEQVKGCFGLNSCVYDSKLYFFFGSLGYNKTVK